MKRKVFEEMTNVQCSEDDFKEIMDIFQETGLDEGVFCEEWKTHGNSRIIRELHVRCLDLESSYEMKMDDIHELVGFLLVKSKSYDDNDFRNKAVEMIGEREVIKKTLDMGLALSDEDKEYLKSVL